MSINHSMARHDLSGRTKQLYVIESSPKSGNFKKGGTTNRDGVKRPEGVSDKDYATASEVVMIHILCHIHRLQ